MTNPDDTASTGRPSEPKNNARAREIALREILQVISANRGDELPVFEAILESAARLCDASTAGLHLVNEARTHTRLVCGWGLDQGTFQIGEEFELGAALAVTTAIREARVVHIPDTADGPLYAARNPVRVRMVEQEGMRTFLVVPLISDGVAFGNINLSRHKVQPFTDDEIALVETFAAQAVIAIENVRQYRELQTRLEREEATSEVLKAISQSRDDEMPVFKMIQEHAARLCNAPFSGLFMLDSTGENLKLVLHTKSEPTYIGDPGKDWPLSGISAMARAVVQKKAIKVDNFSETSAYLSGDPETVRAVDLENISSFLAVPLLSHDQGIGCIGLYRVEPVPFTDDQMQLVKTFAEQAVIAIENTRQFGEVQTRLEREEATREILQVISASRTDTAPVFEVILRNAARLCGAPMASMAVCNDERTHLVMQAHWGETLTHLVVDQTTWPMDGPTSNAVAVREQRIVHTEDIKDTDAYRDGDPGRVEAVDKEGIRIFLAVPLLADGLAIGCISLYRRQVQPFDDGQIELVQSFAAQAVIAIENVRQFRELQTRLEREAATREVLQVISQSRTDEQPVFQTIVQNAARLCGSPAGVGLHLLNEACTHSRLVCSWGPDVGAFPIGTEFNVSNSLPQSIAMREARVVHTPDLAQSPLYLEGDEEIVKKVEDEGVSTFLCVPLLKDGVAIGCFNLNRYDLKPYTEAEISLAETFAEQAVIAIENVRQFKALEGRTAEVVALNSDLEDRVEAQVSQLERLGRLKRFLSPQVADAVVSSGDDNLLGSHRAMIAILFCDIRGFTAFCESAEPEETIEVLQTFHETLGRLIHAAGAGFDHRAGDGIMVVFNDPVPCDDPVGAALRVAVQMRKCMVEICTKWRKLGHRMGFGVGISLGYATVGMVGFEGRYDYTASGTAVNLAARLCDQAKDQEILLSQRAATALEDIAEVESAGELTLKGFHAPVDVFRVSEVKKTQ